MAKHIGCVDEDGPNRVDIAEMFCGTDKRRVGVSIDQETVVLTSEQAIDLAKLLVKAAVGDKKRTVTFDL